MKWWGPVGAIAGVILVGFGFDFFQRAVNLGWSNYIPHLVVGAAMFMAGPFVAVVALVNARRHGRQ